MPGRKKKIKKKRFGMKKLSFLNEQNSVGRGGENFKFKEFDIFVNLSSQS